MKLFSYDTTVLPRVRFIGKINYKTAWKHFTRKIDEFVAYYIKDGEMYIRENNISYHLKAHDFLVLEPNKIHEGYKSAKCDYYYIHFQHDMMHIVQDIDFAMEDFIEKRRRSLISYPLSAEKATDDITYIPKHFSTSALKYQIEFDRIIDIYNKRETFYKNVISTYVHQVLLEISHEMLVAYLNQIGNNIANKADIVAEELLGFLNNNYMNKITSSMIEDMFEMSFDHLNRVFKKISGITIFKFVSKLRIQHAKQLIETSNLSFSEIAYLVGFEDKYYFSRLFRQVTGMTASQYYNRSRM